MKQRLSLRNPLVVEAIRATDPTQRVTVTEAQVVYDALLREGVITRPMAAWGMPSHLRISTGTEQQNQRALAALKTALS